MESMVYEYAPGGKLKSLDPRRHWLVSTTVMGYRQFEYSVCNGCKTVSPWLKDKKRETCWKCREADGELDVNISGIEALCDALEQRDQAWFDCCKMKIEKNKAERTLLEWVKKLAPSANPLSADERQKLAAIETRDENDEVDQIEERDMALYRAIGKKP